MTGPSVVRAIITLGWAIGLLVGSAAVQPAARAGAILIERLDAIPASDVVIAAAENNRDVYAHDEPTQPATANKLAPFSGIGVVEFNNGSGGVRPQDAALIAGFNQNSSSHSDHVLQQTLGTNDEDITSVHDIAVALYHSIYDINSDIAGDLLASYRTISRIRRVVISAVEVPLNAIGVSNLTVVEVAPSTLTDGDHYDDNFHKSDLSRLISRLQFLFSLDALPYYICIFGVYIVFVAFRASVRATFRARHTVRNSYRDRG